MPKQSAQGTESESESDSDLSVEEEPEKTPALLSVQMPTDEKGKAMYQAVQAVWSPRNLSASVEKIKSGIAQFGDIVKALRDSWKDKNESLKKAELPNSLTAGLATQLKGDVAHYRQTVETVINRSLQHAHPAILKRYVNFPSQSSLMHTRIIYIISCFESLKEAKCEDMLDGSSCARGFPQAGVHSGVELSASLWTGWREVHSQHALDSLLNFPALVTHEICHVNSTSAFCMSLY